MPHPQFGRLRDGATRRRDDSMADELERYLGNAIRELSRAHGLKIADISERADLSPSMVSGIENGQTATSLGGLSRIACAPGAAREEPDARLPGGHRSIQGRRSRRQRRGPVMRERPAVQPVTSFDVMLYTKDVASRLSARPAAVSDCGYIRKGTASPFDSGSLRSCAVL